MRRCAEDGKYNKNKVRKRFEEVKRIKKRRKQVEKRREEIKRERKAK